MKEVFQNLPMVTYRRPPNLRDKLIRARIPDPPRMRPKRLIPGCLNCPTCPYLEPGTVIQSSNTSKKIEINVTFSCRTRNVVYCFTCEKCKLQYIGRTSKSLDERVRGHIGYIRNLHTNQPTETNIYFFYSTEVWSINITKFPIKKWFYSHKINLKTPFLWLLSFYQELNEKIIILD